MSSNNVIGLLIYLFCPALLVGQNMVINGDFETYDQCPTEEANWEGYATGWSTFFGTPNYLNCAWYGNNPVITPEAHSGTGLASCVWFDSDYTNPPNVEREYLIGSLKEPLTENQEYYIEYWLFNPSGTVLIKNQYVGLIQAGQYMDIGEYSISTDIALQNTDWLPPDHWHKINGCYTARGGESQIVLGNFLTDSQTEFIDTSIGFLNFNFIDDVGVNAISSLIPADTTLWEGQSYSFDTSLQQSYEIEGQEIESGAYTFNASGLYTVDIYLDGCGFIGSFEIEVIDCDEYIDRVNYAVLSDEIYCRMEGLTVDLEPYPDIHYTLNDRIILEEQLELARIGIDSITMTHEFCGEIQQAHYEGINCDTLDYIEGLECFFIPNVFSPNGDGLNDIFSVNGNCQILEYEMNIYDRWGNLVFRSVDPTAGWDGSYKGEVSATGVYVYIIEIEFIDEGTFSIQRSKGSVTLIR